MLTLTRQFHFPSCSLILQGRRALLQGWQRPPRSLQFELRLAPTEPGETELIRIQGSAEQLSQLQQVVQQYLTRSLLAPGGGMAVPLHAAPARVLKVQESVTLTQRGLLTHELTCGPLKTPHTQIELNATQLFDLANALDTYRQAQQTQQLFLPQPLPWRAIAATVALFTTVMAAGIFYWRRTSTPLPVATSPAIESMERETTPVIPPPPVARPTPLPTPQLPPELAGLEQLPVPAGVDVPARPQPPAHSAGQRPVSGERANTGENSTATIAGAETDPSTDAATGPQPTPTVPALPTLQGGTPERASEAPLAMGEATPTLPTEPLRLPASATDRPSLPTRDAIAQLKEIEQYFARQSHPTELPAQGVVYRLTVGRDGSLTRLRPMSAAAAAAVDRVGLPRLGAVFVSPLATPYRQAEVDVQLWPNGQVETRLESLQ